MQNTNIIQKVLAIFLIITLTFVNILLVSVYFTQGIITYAAGGELELQKSKTNHKNVEFDAYFKVAEEKVHQIQTDINIKPELELYVKVDNEGYIKDAQIQIDTDSNFKISTTENLELAHNITQDKIELNQINSISENTLIVPIELNIEENMNLDMLNKQTTINFTATYVNSNEKETQIEKNITVNVEWIQNHKLNLEQNVEKYITTEDGKTIIQTSLQVGLDLEENQKTYPVKQTNIVANMPMFNNILPEKIVVTAKQTQLTNKNITENFSQENWKINEQENTVEIIVENTALDNQVFVAQGADKYYITYIYDLEDAQTQIELSALAKVTFYDEKTLEKEIATEIELPEATQNTITLSIENDKLEITKGLLYTNTKPEITQVWDINVLYNEGQNLRIEETQTLGITYKQTKINKENLEQVLGKDGYIEILDENSNLIYKIDKETAIDENNDYVIDYETQVNSLKINTSTVENEGNIKLTHVRTIELPQSKEEIKLLDKIVNEIKIGEITAQSEIQLLNTKTNATLKINKENLSTLVENNNVELRIELNDNNDTSDLYTNPTFEIQIPKHIEKLDIKEASVLFNDELQISSTEIINNVIVIKLEGTQTKYNNVELTNGTNIILNTDIKVNILTPAIEDEFILNYTNQDVTQYEQTVEGSLFSDNNITVYGTTNAKINFAAPIGLLNVATIQGYSSLNEKLTAVESDQTGKLEIYDTSKLVTEEILVINSYKEEVVNDITVLGRIPSKDNKTILENENLGSTFDAILTSPITSNQQINATIYYSENINATQDLNDAQNGWMQEVQDLSKVKSYLIKTDKQLNPGEMISFNLELQIPEQLTHNNSTYSTFATYFKTQEQQDAVESSKIGLTTGTGPVLKIEHSSNVPTETVYEYQTIKYQITVTNEGQEPAQNVKVIAKIPEHTTYTYYQEGSGEEVSTGYKLDGTVKQKEFEIGTILPGATKTVSYEVQVNKKPTLDEYYAGIEGLTKDADGDYAIIKTETVERTGPNHETVLEEVTTFEKLDKNPKMEVVSEVELTAKDLAKTITAENIRHAIEKTEFVITENVEKVKIKENEEMELTISIRNNTDEDKQNTILTKTIPEGLLIKQAEKLNKQTNSFEAIKDITLNKENLTLTWNIGTLKAQDVELIKITIQAENLLDGQDDKDVETKVQVTADNTKTYEAQGLTITIVKPKLIIEQKTATQNKYVTKGDKVNYVITVTNQGTTDADQVKIVDIVPNELQIQGVRYTVNNNTITKSSSANTVNVTSNVLLGQTLTLEIDAIVAHASTTKEITNIATVSAMNVSEKQTNQITHIIEASPGEQGQDEQPSDKDNQEQDEQPTGTYKITGIVWYDENSNATSDSEEQGVKDIKVRLLDASTHKLIQNALTDENGEYTFSNLPVGKYLVAFIYDSSKYSLAEYKKTGVDENKNSDVIATKLEENGQTYDAAVTDIIEIETTSKSNIDMGLVESKNFDLKLDKYVVKMTVQNNNGTKSYDFNDKTLAKIEIPAKELSSSTVIIEYKIKVTNQGDVEGYAKKIIDYLPEELTFTSDLNPTWYQTTDGMLHNTELEQAIINPGETKQVQLILTKKMTSNNTGTISNKAEIELDYNQYGAKDINSTPNNQTEKENDTGIATTIISIKTGENILYITITLTAIGILVALTLIIIKKRRK